MRHNKHGTLSSGSNGVGKSAAAVQAFETCFAQGLVVVYIASAVEWAAAAEQGDGDDFFLRRLLMQNADLIAAEPVLRAALAPALLGGRLDGMLMTALLRSLEARPGPAVGVIVDEVQAITKAVERGAAAGASAEERCAARYFRKWHNWDTATKVFVRMDVASSHGARELTLPSGEEHRLRVMKPWTKEMVAAALAMPASPVAFEASQSRARDRVAFIAGGIPRELFKGKRRVDECVARGMDTEAVVASLDHFLMGGMRESCQRWFETLSDDNKDAAVRVMLPLVRGEVMWDRVKGLYDDGLVARCGDDTRVAPVSVVAASVIINTMARRQRACRAPLASIPAGEDRGFELERQLLSSLEVAKTFLPAKGFDGLAAPSVPASADCAVVFNSIPEEVTAHDSLATLFIPLSKSFPCDAITVPASCGDASAPIVVWEPSVTQPQDRKEQKLQAWFADGGIIPQLQKAHPARSIVCALCWDGDLPVGKVSAKCKRWLTAAKKASAVSTVTIVVVDRQGLQRLGVLA